MTRLILVLFGTMMLIYIIYHGYWPWIKPDQYLEREHKMRDKIKQQYAFLLPQIWIHSLLNNYPSVDVLGARLVSLFLTIIVILFIVGACFSPYVK